MGGDNSPNKTIEGIKFFLDKNGKNDDFTLNIFGKEQELTELLSKYNISSSNIKIFNSNTVVSDDEKPITAVKNSKTLVCGIALIISLRENQI